MPPALQLPEEQTVLRTHLRAVIESLRQERERLAESRRSAETAVALRVTQLEEQWARECDTKYRQLAQAALEQARQQVEHEQAAQSRAVELARAELERERRALEAERHALEALRQEFEPAAAALRERQAKFARDRRAWEEYRDRQLDQLEQQRTQRVESADEGATHRQTELPPPSPRPSPPAKPGGEGEQLKSSAFDDWYADKLAGIRQMMSAGRSGADSGTPIRGDVGIGKG